jgi:hypothetical protein
MRKKPMFFRTCNYCGAALDPGEKCDCQDQKQQRDEQISKALRMDPWGQMEFKEDIWKQAQ